MKKYIGFLIVLSVVFLGASQAKAVTIDDLQKQIQNLSLQISSLKSQLTGSALGAFSPIPSTTVIQKGTISTEVTTIQSALKSQGYFTGNATGYYGDITAKAVLDYQKVKGLPATGIVDASTKTSIFSTASTSSTTTPSSTKPTTPPCSNDTATLVATAASITVISPNGGEVFAGVSGTTVKWKSCGIPLTSNIKIVIQDLSNSLPGFPATLFLADASNDGQEFITFPAGYGNSFKIQVKEAEGASPVSDVSDKVFSIVPATTATITEKCNARLLYPHPGEQFDLAHNATPSGSSINIDVFLQVQPYDVNGCAWNTYGSLIPGASPMGQAGLVGINSTIPPGGLQSGAPVFILGNLNFSQPTYGTRIYHQVISVSPSSHPNGNYFITLEEVHNAGVPNFNSLQVPISISY